jgi:hypothetical protein
LQPLGVELANARPCHSPGLPNARRARFNQRSLTSGALAAEYGFTDLDGSRPDVWRYKSDVEKGKPDANPEDYRG